MNSENILIVEDDLISARIIQSILTKSGYKCAGISASAEDCLKLLEKSCPDLILMDINLTGRFDGIYAAQKIRELYDLPVVFITGVEEKEMLQKAKLTEPYGFLLKPVNRRDIEATIEISLYRHKISKELKENERFLSSILGNTPGMVYRISDLKGFKYGFVSNGCVELTGYSKESYNKFGHTQLIIQRDKKKVLNTLRYAVKNKKRYEAVYRIKTGREEEKWVLDKGQYVELEPGIRFIEGLVTDITTQKQTEEMLKLEHEKLDAVTNSIGVGLALINRKFSVEWTNNVLKNQFPEILEKKCYQTIGHCEGICKNCTALDVFNKGMQTSVREMYYQDEKGNDRWFELIASPVKSKGKKITHCIEVVVPITEKKKMEESIKESKQIRALAAHLESIREEEKTNIAREIHDELGQALTALKFDVVWLNKKIINYTDVFPQMVLDKFVSMSNLIDATMKTIRKISSDLRPVILDDLGLLAALEWQVSEFQMRTGIKCVTKFNVGNIEFVQQKKIAFYRMFQEMMTNIARHSLATKVKIILKEYKNQYLLEISDNGIGINKKQLKSQKSLGLIGMKERTLLLGGDLKIEGKKNLGTSITVKIPKKDIVQESNN